MDVLPQRVEPCPGRHEAPRSVRPFAQPCHLPAGAGGYRTAAGLVRTRHDVLALPAARPSGPSARLVTRAAGHAATSRHQMVVTLRRSPANVDAVPILDAPADGGHAPAADLERVAAGMHQSESAAGSPRRTSLSLSTQDEAAELGARQRLRRCRHDQAVIARIASPLGHTTPTTSAASRASTPLRAVRATGSAGYGDGREDAVDHAVAGRALELGFRA